MDGATFKAWRLGMGLSQPGAGDRFSVTDRTVKRWESGETPIPDDVAELIRSGAEPPPVGKLMGPAPTLGPRKETVLKVGPRFDPEAAGLKRWVRPDGLQPRDLTKNPVGDGWQVLEWRVIHGSIPEPLAYDAPEWAGPLAIVTASGRCFHYATGREIKPWGTTGRGWKPNDGSKANLRKVKGG